MTASDYRVAPFAPASRLLRLKRTPTGEAEAEGVGETTMRLLDREPILERVLPQQIIDPRIGEDGGETVGLEVEEAMTRVVLGPMTIRGVEARAVLGPMRIRGVEAPVVLDQMTAQGVDLVGPAQEIRGPDQVATLAAAGVETTRVAGKLFDRYLALPCNLCP